MSCIQKSRAATAAALRLHTQSVQCGRHQISLGVRQLVAVSQIGCVTTAQVLQLRNKSETGREHSAALVLIYVYATDRVTKATLLETGLLLDFARAASVQKCCER